MNITTSMSSPFLRPQAPRAASTTEGPGLPSESFTFSGDSDINLKDGITWGLIGAVPALGAVSNFTIGAVTGIAGQRRASGAAIGGLYANVLGTGALIAGAIIGNTPTTLIGGGLLLASGIAGGYGAAQTR